MDPFKIDQEIKRRFREQQESVPELRHQEETYTTLLATGTPTEPFRQQLEAELRGVQERLRAIEQGTAEHFYTMRTHFVLEAYNDFMRRPRKASFLDDAPDPAPDPAEKACLDRYLALIRPLHNPAEPPPTQPAESVCAECGGETVVDTSFKVCRSCGAQDGTEELTLLADDPGRVHPSQKYNYDRRTHFVNCIKQYQGVQNCSLEPEVLDLLERELLKYNLVDTDAPDQRTRYARVQKQHILLLLKEFKISKHYENLNLIFHRITGRPLDNIAHLVDALVRDFDTFVQLYDRKYATVFDKKNFNYQYLLFQFLRKNGHPCDARDFNLLKTTDRKAYHDEITRQIFEELGFNFESLM